MTNVIFNPWVGNEYNKQNNKIFVLGESHYDTTEQSGNTKKKEDNNFTKDIVKQYLKYKTGKNTNFERWMNTYTKFTNCILDYNNVTKEKIVEFWNSIIFYNYIQKSLDKPRQKPKECYYKDSESAFIEVLDKYKPDKIIVWGKRLWDNLLKESIIYDKDSKKHFVTENKEKLHIEIFHINHPSSRHFNYNYWKKLNIKLI